MGEENMPCSLNRIARLMRPDNLVAIQKRKFRVTTNSKHNYPVWPNILNRDFSAEKPNAVWVTDITYIWTFEGWLYLAAIMDKTIEDTLTLSAESFFHTLKVELVHKMKFRTREEAKRKVFEYVEMYYNTRRANSTLKTLFTILTNCPLKRGRAKAYYASY